MRHWSDFKSNVALFMCRTKCINYVSKYVILNEAKHAHYGKVIVSQYSKRCLEACDASRIPE